MEPNDVDSAFQEIAQEVAEEMAHNSPNPLVPEHTLVQQHMQKVLQKLTAHKARLERGAILLYDKASDEDKKVFGKLAGLVLGEDMQNKSLQELADINLESLNRLYQVATQALHEERFEEAVDVFSFLTEVAPQQYECWLGLANALFFLHALEEAESAYSQACEINPSNPLCYLGLSRCFMARGEKELALSTLDSGLLLIEQNPEHAGLQELFEGEKLGIGGRV